MWPERQKEGWYTAMTTIRVKVKALQTGLMAALLVLAMSSASQAGPLGVNISPTPDIIAQFISSSYVATTGAFLANGWAMTLDTGTKQTITTQFALTANINNNGTFNSGSLTIGSSASPLLRTTTLLGFAYDNTVMEFLFGTISGSYVPSLYSATEPLDVMLTPGALFPGTSGAVALSDVFKANWTATSGTAEVREDPAIPNPEPTATALMLVGGATMLWQRRRSRAALKHS